MRAILASEGSFDVVAPPLWIGEIETGTTYLENARLKAHSVRRMTTDAVLAEDTGLEIDALGDLPGVHSARFAGPPAKSADNVAKALRLLDGVPVERRTARYRIVAVLVLPSGAEVTGEGVLEGRIASGAKGSGGFGYDPIFIPAGEERTVAEMGAEEKDAISHRALALRELAQKLGASNR